MSIISFLTLLSVMRQIVSAPLSRAHFLGGERQQIARVTLLRSGATTSIQLERTGGTQLRIEAHLPTGGASGENGSRLSLWAGQGVGVAFFIVLNDKVGETEFVCAGLCATNCSLNESHLLLVQGIVADFSAVATVGDQGFEAGALFQIGQGFRQQLSIIHIVRRHLHFGDQLDLIFRITSLGDVRDVAFVMSGAFRAVAGFEVIYRLQAGRGNLRIFFGAWSAFQQIEILCEYALQDLVGKFGSVAVFQLLQQRMNSLPDPLQMFLLRCLAFDAVGVMSGAVLDVGRKAFTQARAICLIQYPFDPLDGCHQQLQAAGADDVAGDLRRVHSLHASADFQIHDLGIRDLLTSRKPRDSPIFGLLLILS